RARCSSVRGPIRSTGGPRRSSGTSWASGSSASPATFGWTRSCRGRRCRGTDAVAGGAMTDARKFLGMEPVADELHWQLTVVPELTTPGNFLFGGCGLGAALVALEAACGRPTVWSTAQYLSYAPTGSELELTVTLAAEGRRITQGRVVGYVGGAEILTVNAAAGSPADLAIGGVWVRMPEVPPPEECPPRRLPNFSSTSIFDRIDVRLARGRSVEQISAAEGQPGD